MIMQVVPFVREGLGNSSYLVQVGESEAVLIDPDRSVDRYLRSARERGWKIGAVLETHLHADFVSGALEVGYLTNTAELAEHGADRGADDLVAFRGQKPEGRIEAFALDGSLHR